MNHLLPAYRHSVLCLCLFITGLVYYQKATAQVNLTQGLMAYYPFNGNANDASGNANHPSVTNATLTADKAGSPNSAYRFNGIDNYIRIPNRPTLNTTNKISLSVWVKAAGFY